VSLLGGGDDDAVSRVVVAIGQGDGACGNCAVNRDFNESGSDEALTPLDGGDV
jgi:hypothetical protein